jgi:hypothetical protein
MATKEPAGRRGQQKSVAVEDESVPLDESVPIFRATLRLGNVEAKDTRTVVDDDGTETIEFTHVAGNRVCSVGIRARTISEAFADVTAPNGLWVHQSWQPPAWVEGDHEGLVQMLAGYYGCPVGRTKGEWIE